MMSAARSVVRAAGLLRRTTWEFVEDAGTTMAAATAYYAVFSLPPMLVIVMLVAGSMFDPEAVSQALTDQTRALIGTEAAGQIRRMIQSSGVGSFGNPATAVLSTGALVVGATTTFSQLQYGLNQMWRVELDPDLGMRAMIRRVVVKRIFSFGVIVIMALLLLISLVITTIITVVGQRVSAIVPSPLFPTLVSAADTLLSLLVATLLFAAVFKILPDVELRWGDVWVGAGLTGALFVIGKFLIGYYLGQADPGSTFGASGSLAVILIWIYYTTMILLFGAKFTQLYVRSRRGTVEPSPGAVRIE